MAKWYPKLCVLALLLSISPANAEDDLCTYLNGAILLNSDNEFIGSVESSFASDSIYNAYGTYGNEFSPKSIWNEFGKNGNEFSANSAFNELATNPPRLIKNRKILGYLTVNTSIAGGIHPTELGVICFDFKPSR